MKRFWVYARLWWRGGVNVVHAFRGENLRLRAMALTYISLFAIVPALVVVFSVVQAITGLQRISATLHDFLFENLAVGTRETIEAYLDKFVANSHAATAGIIGAAVLCFSAVNLFHHVERAINDIWGVRRRRPLAQQLLVYWAALTLGPILLAGSVSLGRSARLFLEAGGASVLGAALIRLGVLASTSLFFALLYLIAPKTKVRVRWAALGGMVAGLAWEGAKFLYTYAVTKFFHYHAVYGSIAAVPIFIIWLYVSWTLVLFGARVAFVAQHAPSLLRGRESLQTPAARQLLAARIMLDVARSHDRGLAPPEPDAVAVRLGAVAEAVHDMVIQLRLAGLVTEAAGGGLLPARPLSRITLADVRSVVAGPPLDTSARAAQTDSGLLAALLGTAEEKAQMALSDVTLQRLCDEQRARERSTEPAPVPGPQPA